MWQNGWFLLNRKLVGLYSEKQRSRAAQISTQCRCPLGRTVWTGPPPTGRQTRKELEGSFFPGVLEETVTFTPSWMRSLMPTELFWLSQITLSWTGFYIQNLMLSSIMTAKPNESATEKAMPFSWNKDTTFSYNILDPKNLNVFKEDSNHVFVERRRSSSNPICFIFFLNGILLCHSSLQQSISAHF